MLQLEMNTEKWQLLLFVPWQPPRYVHPANSADFINQKYKLQSLYYFHIAILDVLFIRRQRLPQVVACCDYIKPFGLLDFSMIFSQYTGLSCSIA